MRASYRVALQLLQLLSWLGFDVHVPAEPLLKQLCAASDDGHE